MNALPLSYFFLIDQSFAENVPACVAAKVRQGPSGIVTGETHLSVEPGHLDWELIEYFVVVAEAGGFRQAQRQTGFGIETLRRRISSLEASLKGKLFHRQNTGLLLTPLGEAVLERGRTARDYIASIARISRRNSIARGGLVSLSVPEGLSLFWLMPRLRSFKNDFPDLVFDINSSMRRADINQNEADIVIQYEKPTSPNVICKRLGFLHIILYCSNEYAESNGIPQSFADLKNHRMAYQSSDQLDETVFLKLFDVDDPSGVVQYRVNSSFALFQLARTGNVLVALPTFTSAFRENLIPIDFGGTSYPIEVWLAYHPDAKEFGPARALISWLNANFDNRKFPWFAEEYIKPENLAGMDCKEWLINMGHYQPR